MYTCDEIDKEFLGKFVYLTNVKFTEFMELIEGIAVLIADRAYEDVDKGIYSEFDDKNQYGVVYGYDLRCWHFPYSEDASEILVFF